MKTFFKSVLVMALVACSSSASPASGPCPVATTGDGLIANALVNEQIAEIGCSAEGGKLAWVSDEVLSLTDAARPLQSPFSPFKDFILGFELSWAGQEDHYGRCGAVVRANADFDRVIELSTEVGLPFVTWKLNAWEDGASTYLTEDQGMHDDALMHDSNRYVITASGNTLTVFANGTQLGSASIPAGYEQGGIAFYAFSADSSQVSCSFTNAWVVHFE